MDELTSEDAAVGAYGASRHTGTSVAVHAGFPNPAAERTGAPLSLDRLLVRHPSSTYFFRIRGHNWHDYGVFDGDIAVIDRAIAPREQALVVWWQASGEFALSPFRRADRQNIWGVVTTVVHQFTAD
ncbi:MAG TPA: S24 family peptidase [Candidatus Saccharimonadales bacterium]|nr:S24 family peptidase [Candidatus Saccharimonadales bacterium]